MRRCAGTGTTCLHVVRSKVRHALALLPSAPGFEHVSALAAQINMAAAIFWRARVGPPLLYMDHKIADASDLALWPCKFAVGACWPRYIKEKTWCSCGCEGSAFMVSGVVVWGVAAPALPGGMRWVDGCLRGPFICA